MADLVWSDPDPEKEDFAISPRYRPVASLARLRMLTVPIPRYVVAQATRLDRVSFTSSWRRTRCHTSFAPISCVWKAIRHYSTSISPQYGLHQTTATDAATPPASSRWAQVARCSSMYSKLRRRMSGMDQVIKLHRTREGRCVTMRASPLGMRANRPC